MTFMSVLYIGQLYVCLFKRTSKQVGGFSWTIAQRSHLDRLIDLLLQHTSSIDLPFVQVYEEGRLG
jgi:hypothetical protein